MLLEPDAEGHPDPNVDIVAAARAEPLSVLSLRAHGIREFHWEFMGRPIQVLGFAIESLHDRQMEGIAWRVYDYEANKLGFLCRDIEVLSYRPGR